MSDVNTGRCACGAVCIETLGEPIAELHCQCTHCQLRSGTGHSSFAVFAGADSVKINGTTSCFAVTGDSGNEKHQAFCPRCGTPTHVTFPANPEITAISPVLLNRPDQFAPKIVTYASRAQMWDLLDPALTHFEEMPTR